MNSAGTSLQDATAALGLTCSPNDQTINETLVVLATPIAAGGSFAANSTRHGAITVNGATHAAVYTDTLTGRLTAAGASGTLSETVTYNDGSAETCQSGTKPFAVTRDNQGVQTAAAPVSGSYSGDGLSNNYPVSFFVAAGGRSVLDLTATGYPACYPNNVQLDPRLTEVSIASMAINADGSFSGSSSVSGGGGCWRIGSIRRRSPRW